MENLKHGWIKLNRSVQDHWVWQDKPFSKGQAWIDLILLANHQDGKIAHATRIEKIPRGSFITSQYKLAERWGWTRFRVHSFLICLEFDGMITLNCTSNYTTISLVNYEKFQNSLTTNSTSNQPRTNYEPTTNQLRADTNNKLKNIKNEKNEKNKGVTAVPSEQGEPEDDGGWLDADDLVIPERFYKDV